MKAIICNYRGRDRIYNIKKPPAPKTSLIGWYFSFMHEVVDEVRTGLIN